MKQKSNTKKTKAEEPILDFILGKTNTLAAKRLTKNISCIQSLWILAKMTRVVKKCSEE